MGVLGPAIMPPPHTLFLVPPFRLPACLPACRSGHRGAAQRRQEQPAQLPRGQGELAAGSSGTPTPARHCVWRTSGRAAISPSAGRHAKAEAQVWEHCADPRPPALALACAALLRCLQERSIVSSMAGTTRDAIDTGVWSCRGSEAVPSGGAAEQPEAHSLPGLGPHPSPATASTRPIFVSNAIPLSCQHYPLATAADLTLTDGRKFTLVDTAGVRKRTAVASSKDGAEVRLCAPECPAAPAPGVNPPQPACLPLPQDSTCSSDLPALITPSCHHHHHHHHHHHPQNTHRTPRCVHCPPCSPCLWSARSALCGAARWRCWCWTRERG